MLLHKPLRINKYTDYDHSYLEHGENIFLYTYCVLRVYLYWRMSCLSLLCFFLQQQHKDLRTANAELRKTVEDHQSALAVAKVMAYPCESRDLMRHVGLIEEWELQRFIESVCHGMSCFPNSITLITVLQPCSTVVFAYRLQEEECKP